MVNAGDVLTFDISGTTDVWVPIDSTALRSGVANQLARYFAIQNFPLTVGSTISNMETGQWLNWNYSAVLTVRALSAYASADDIASVIGHAFYQTAGAFPSISLRGGGITQSPPVIETGPQPGDLIPDLPGLGKNVGEGLGNLLKPLTDLLQNAEGLLVVGIVVIVGLVVFSPAGREAGRGVKLWV